MRLPSLRKLLELMFFSHVVPIGGGRHHDDDADKGAALDGADRSVSSAGSGSNSSESSAGGGPTPTATWRAMIFRMRIGGGDPVKMGVCIVHYYAATKVFTAYPEKSPSTFNLVAKAPIPDDGEGMDRPEVKNTVNGRYKTYVRFRDYSQLVNAQRFAVDDASVFEAVEDGRSRVYSLIFRTLPELESFATLYVEASLPGSNTGEDDASSSNADSSSSDDDDDEDSHPNDGESKSEEEEGEDGDDDDAARYLDGESQDLMQLYYNSAAASRAMKGLNIQSSIEESGDISSSDASDE